VAVLRYWLWLSLKQGIGPKRIHTLLSRFGNPEEVYRADRRTLETCPGIKADEIAQLVDKDLTVAENVFNLCREKRIKILTPEHELYPKLLLEIPDPPYVLYARYAERINLNEHLTVSVVGTREASDKGMQNAETLSMLLAQQGVTVVSGMAKGIDGAAHRGALAGGGKTVAVLAGGVDIASPPRHAGLMREIIKHGMVLSEYPPGTPSIPGHFPVRNRLISGLSRGVVLVEVPEKSGAQNTVKHALEQSRDVFSVPADITNTLSMGSNRWLAKGALPVLDVSDILEVYQGPYKDLLIKNKPTGNIVETEPDEALLAIDKAPAKPKKKPKKKQESAPVKKAPQVDESDLSEEERAVLALISETPIHIDTLAEQGFSPAILSATLTTLEMRGLIQALTGKYFCLPNSDL